MSTRVVVENKYTLRSLHQEIDLFDRKLAHMALYDLSPEGPTRDALMRNLNLKREQMEKKARQLAADGVAFEESELPRSFRAKDAPLSAELPATLSSVAAPVEVEAPAERNVAPRQERRHPSAFAGTSLDADRILTYMRDRKAAH